ncbi:MAG: heparinase II/III family protein [Vicinamibacteria bacterium]
MAEAVRGRDALRLRRLARMSLDEVAVRGWQEARKLAERWGPPARSAPWAWRARESRPRNPFAWAAKPEPAPLLVERHPDHVRQLLDSAEALLEGRFRLLGYADLRFGDPVDWHLDPLAGRRAPRVHWSRIDPLDAQAVGDSKVIWELNRHQWLVTLAQAHRIGGEPRHAAGCAGYLRSWLRENPCGVGINWASSLEVALRLVSWCWVLALLEEALDADVARALVEGIARHADHLWRYPSLYSSPNTHLTGEALGLVYAGSFLADHPHAARWRSRGRELLVRESVRQIHPDGVYFEQATCYQRYTVEILLHLLLLARVGSEPAPPVADALQLMLDFLLATRRPDGGMPSIGDADGGWLLPLARRGPGDLRGVFALAAALFARPDYAWAAGGAAPELAWLLGAEGERAFEALAPAPPAGPASRCFEAGGYAVMASGWQRDAHRLIFDVGPLGCPVSSGHGHADLLAIQCDAFGGPCVVDPGTYVYTPLPRWRDHFRSARAHSTVGVDDREPAAPAGPFAWSARPAARLRRWLASESFDYADAEHDALGAPGAPLRWRRRVLFVKPRFWVVADELLGRGEHSLEARFQLAPLAVLLGPGAWVRVRGSGGRGLALLCLAPAPLPPAVHLGEGDPIRGWVSPDYGRVVPAPLVVFAARRPLPCRLITLLQPLADLDAPLPEVAPVASDDLSAYGLCFPGTGERVLFTEHEVSLECAASPESSR